MSSADYLWCAIIQSATLGEYTYATGATGTGGGPDNNGNPRMQVSKIDASALKFRELYSYDGWNRLTQVREERDAGSENWVDPLEESYCYDAHANRAVVARAN
ncbi:MAG: hypothetical protein KJZ78_12825, partial [Bryobacteraceae bacterium]|nr:hypothetical protein [Bryobacteraceae bacterium]